MPCLYEQKKHSSKKKNEKFASTRRELLQNSTVGALGFTHMGLLAQAVFVSLALVAYFAALAVPDLALLHLL